MSTQTGRNVRVEIAATYDTAKTVSAVTKANPGVASSTSHGMANGTIGYFSDTTEGMNELAGAAFSVANQATSTFELQAENTTSYGTFTSGTFTPVLTWSTLSTATSYSIGDAAADQIDTTTLLDRLKQSEIGLLASQTVTIEGFSDPQSAAALLIRAAALNVSYVVVRITLSNGERRIFRGMPSLPGESLSVGQKATGSLTFAVKRQGRDAGRMTPAERLIAAMRAQRLSWVVLEPAKDGRAEKRVQITRPPESAMPDFLVKTEDGGYTLKAELRHVEAYTVGWEGITEADLVGPAGSSDPAAFAPALWSVVVADKLAWLQAVATAILEAIVKHRESLEADAKNS
jgi:hypothetical protein